MIARLVQIRTEVLTALGLTATTSDAVHRDSINLRINQIQDWIWYSENWEWRKRNFYLTTIDDYSTGTIAVTSNSRTVTGTNTVWTDAHKMGYLRVNARYYKIDRVASSTSIILASPYPDATESGLSYNLVFPDYYLPGHISSIISLVHEGRELEPLTKERLDTGDDMGSPIAYAITDRMHETFYSTGTAAVTNDSAAITGSGTTWTALMDGMPFQVNATSEIYTVRERTSATAITLDRPYQGTTNATASYTIGRVGSPIIRISHLPDDYYFLTGEGLLAPVPLIGDNDISLIPNHAPILHGATWLALHDFENANPVKVQQAEADFTRSMKQLKEQYRTITSYRWTAEEELRRRRVGGTGLFNPLSRTGV